MPRPLFAEYSFPTFIKDDQRKYLCSMVDLAYLTRMKKHYKKARWLKKYRRIENKINNMDIINL